MKIAESLKAVPCSSVAAVIDERALRSDRHRTRMEPCRAASSGFKKRSLCTSSPSVVFAVYRCLKRREPGRRPRPFWNRRAPGSLAAGAP